MLRWQSASFSTASRWSRASSRRSPISIMTPAGPVSRLRSPRFRPPTRPAPTADTTQLAPNGWPDRPFPSVDAPFRGLYKPAQPAAKPSPPSYFYQLEQRLRPAPARITDRQWPTPPPPAKPRASSRAAPRSTPRAARACAPQSARSTRQSPPVTRPRRSPRLKLPSPKSCAPRRRASSIATRRTEKCRGSLTASPNSASKPSAILRTQRRPWAGVLRFGREADAPSEDFAGDVTAGQHTAAAQKPLSHAVILQASHFRRARKPHLRQLVTEIAARGTSIPALCEAAPKNFSVGARLQVHARTRQAGDGNCDVDSIVCSFCRR